MPRDERRMTFIVVPHGEGDLSTRSFEVSYRRLRVVALLLGLAVGLWLLAVLSWGYLAAQAARVPGLERKVEALQADNARVEQLAAALARMEQRYRQLQIMLGADALRVKEERKGAEVPVDSTATLPTAWPLEVKGYVTRGHLAKVRGEHPGMDVAVRQGSAVRAAGGGTVAEVGEDSVYGRFVRIRHREGYESMYGHLSGVEVEEGATVAGGQVIARSGNTGLSTAPHLHFEIRKDGEAVDPRSLVQTPR
jgi:murein DD-endopeptidase MepM/ murein hydrolase activator NlpD